MHILSNLNNLWKNKALTSVFSFFDAEAEDEADEEDEDEDEDPELLDFFPLDW